jgi:large subunit ribosomal protein L6
MSQVWKKPVLIPTGVTVKIEDGKIIVKGAKGELSQQVHPVVQVNIGDNSVVLDIIDGQKTNAKDGKALAGLWRQLINNMIIGVSAGFTKKLELVGVGYKAIQGDKNLVFHLGFSHTIDFKLPLNIAAEVTKNIINIIGVDKQLVGDVSAKIKKLKPVEPYKGNGIRYVGEVVRRKAGKVAKTGSAK